jgi:hypothetical protein
MVDYSKVTTNKYFPNKSPNEYSEGFMSGELSKISFAIDQVSMGHLDVQNVAPEKPRQGDIRYASGTGWNPSSGGEGLYFFNAAGSWVKL